jgi:tetratricopeptide (TPR) repeat protein
MLAPLLALVLAVCLLAGCNEDDVERSLGKQTSAAVEREFGVNHDPVLAEWVNTLGQRLVGQSKRQQIPYHFTVINTDMVNAFAAPYGHLYVTLGLLRFATTEDELAFIMGHEVGHVASRDSIKSFKNNLLFNIGAALLGTQGDSLRQIGGLGAGLLLLHYSRGDERDADVSGSTFAYSAGYDPAGGLAFFDRLKKEIEKDRPSSIEYLFLTHPPTDARIKAGKTRPEMNLNDPAVASRIGRSYARRYAYATACTFYKQALDKQPDAVQTRLAYGDALAAQGLLDQARAQYDAVLQAQAANKYATSGLAAVTAGPQTWTVATPAERQQAGEVLSLADNVATGSAALVTASHEFRQSAQAPTAGVTGIARGSIGNMVEIANREKDLPMTSRELFVRANGAISSAHETAFTLEYTNDAIVQVSELVRRDTDALKVAVQQVQSGQAASGDLAMYRRALIEMQLAQQQLQQAAGDSRAAQPLVKRAAESARQTVTALGTMVGATSPSRYLYPVRVLSGQTEGAAAAARQAVRQVKSVVTTAEARALLARLNLAALGASPEQRAVYDGMTAYYCHVSPREVKALRDQGLGFGDAAFLLIAARTRGVPAASYLSWVKQDRVIDGMRGEGFDMQGPVALLRFLSGAVDRETASRVKG